jgi:hypothetical protein
MELASTLDAKEAATFGITLSQIPQDPVSGYLIIMDGQMLTTIMFGVTQVVIGVQVNMVYQPIPSF